MDTTTSKGGRRIAVRRSSIHGKGVFATMHIPAGTRLIEYKGERISEDDSEHLYTETTHTFLFMLENNEVIDGSRNGNAARWINHSCEPNCEAIEEDGRVFIDALAGIEPGEEITIDYNLYLEARYTAALKRQYACGCGTVQCRGTLLASKR
ncbi:MAG TPA: SET domain-containing protein-lysine N-methyltransferase [Burkholderiales bacterium]|nr:SET domain-containing protein-lysine N-methyltransferase [Burkholderiales bacterium]